MNSETTPAIPHGQELQSLTNADLMINSGSHLIQREQYKNTLIQIIGIKEGWFLALANNRITDVHPTKEDLLAWINANELQMLIVLISVIADLTVEAHNK